MEVEKVITANRRIDIYVKMGQGKATHCLAIENKPYAEDQKDQVKDYLKYLEKRYSERFFLIYLSPRGEGPSDWSLPAKELGQWKERFAILPYCTVDSERDLDPREGRPDRFDDFLLSLAEFNDHGGCWLRPRVESEVKERLSTFAHDMCFGYPGVDADVSDELETTQ